MMNDGQAISSVTVQYKGTDICVDFRCCCSPGSQGHFDGLGAYALKCGNCGRLYEMPTEITLKPVDHSIFEAMTVYIEPEDQA